MAQEDGPKGRGCEANIFNRGCEANISIVEGAHAIAAGAADGHGFPARRVQLYKPTEHPVCVINAQYVCDVPLAQASYAYVCMTHVSVARGVMLSSANRHG